MASRNQEVGSWIKGELSRCDFNDHRLDERLQFLASELARSPSKPINNASSDWAATKAAYRFFENPKVSSEKILESHYLSTAERIQNQNRVVVVQDTTVLNFDPHTKTKGLGPISTHKGAYEQMGLFSHVTMALTEKGVPLGLLDNHIWARKNDTKQRAKLKSYDFTNTPLEEKESFKWIRGLRRTHERTGDLGVVVVADREADLFELFDESLDDGIDLVIRMRHDRMLADEELDYISLRDKLSVEEIKGQVRMEVPGSGKRKPRKVRLNLKYTPITFSAHGRGIKNQVNKDRHDLDLYAVELLERPHSQRKEPPLHWILITSLEVKTTKQALEVMNFYKMRWMIETFFKCLKTGCSVEDCRLETAQKLINYISLLSVVAWRILWMTHLHRNNPDQSCESVFTEIEWQALWIRQHKRVIKTGKMKPHPPEDPPSLAEAMRWLAMQGGFLGRKGDGEPGLITIWRGWLELIPAAEMYEVLHNHVRH